MITYDKIYKFLKNTIIVLSLLIGVKSYAVEIGDPLPDYECRVVTSLSSANMSGWYEFEPPSIDACSQDSKYVAYENDSTLVNLWMDGDLRDNGTSMWCIPTAQNFVLSVDPYTCPIDTFLNPTDCSCSECPVGEAKNNLGECTTDSDGDGSPDEKCPDGYSLDFSGVCFADADGDGIPDSVDDDSNTDGQCKGYNNNDVELIPFTSSYSVSDFSYINLLTKGLCDSYLDRTDVDAILIKQDLDLGCPSEYCFVHYTTSDCWKLNSSDYYPSPDWILGNASSEVGCAALVDGVEYDQSTYVIPNTICAVGFCYVHPVIDIYDPNDSNNSQGAIELDANSSQAMLDIAPLLDAANRTNEILELTMAQNDDTNKKIDETNNKLTESLLIQNDQLTELKGLVNKIDNDGIKSRIDTSNSKLDSINSNLVNQTLAVSSSDINNVNGLNTIADKLDTLIAQDSDSNTTLSIDFGSVDDTGFLSSMSSMDVYTDELTEFTTNMNNDLTIVKDSYAELTALVDTGLNVSHTVSVTSCPETVTVPMYGTHTFDICAQVSPYSNLIYLLFYTLGMVGVMVLVFRLFTGGD